MWIKKQQFDNDGASDLTICDRSAFGWYVRKASGGGVFSGESW